MAMAESVIKIQVCLDQTFSWEAVFSASTIIQAKPTIITVRTATAKLLFTPLMPILPKIATKAAVKVFSDGLRQDLVDTPIRVTNIQPGMVETSFATVRFHGDEAKAKAVYNGIQPLVAEDIACLVLFAIQAPTHVQVCEMTVTPTHQATGGVVYRA